MEYDLYHDESKESGYWHGMLLVPVRGRESLLLTLQQVRDYLHYADPVMFKGLKKRSGKQFNIVRSWLEIGAADLAQRMKGDPMGYHTGRIIFGNRGFHNYEIRVLKELIGAKLIIFRIRDGHCSIENEHLPDEASKVETTLRMGLKGGMHLLGSQEDPMHIRSFHFDGHEHYGRHVDIDRIVGRLTKLRPYASLAENLVVDDRTSDHRRYESQAYEDCQLLQLTDILVGAFRTILGESKNIYQSEVSYPVKQLVDRWGRGFARMKNSRWYGGFCVSQCYLVKGEWQFENIWSGDAHNSSQIAL